MLMSSLCPWRPRSKSSLEVERHLIRSTRRSSRLIGLSVTAQMGAVVFGFTGHLLLAGLCLIGCFAAVAALWNPYHETRQQWKEDMLLHVRDVWIYENAEARKTGTLDDLADIAQNAYGRLSEFFDENKWGDLKDPPAARAFGELRVALHEMHSLTCDRCSTEAETG